MPTDFKQIREQEIDTIGIAELSENSMRATQAGNAVVHTIDIKSRCQGIVLDKSYNDIQSIRVKLIASDIPDTEYYDLESSFLQSILQERYGNLAANINQNALIPFSTVGNLPFNDDSYVQVTIILKAQSVLNYDRVISAYEATSPIVVKQLEDATHEFESSSFDELFLFNNVPDINYTLNGKKVHIPQLLIMNTQLITGVASIKLVNNTTYSFSSAVSNIFLVEFPNN